MARPGCTGSWRAPERCGRNAGEKWHYAPMAARLAQAGVIVGVLSYTLYPQVQPLAWLGTVHAGQRRLQGVPPVVPAANVENRTSECCGFAVALSL